MNIIKRKMENINLRRWRIKMLIEIDSLELMHLWGELLECFHNVNGYGSDTAEIYAYRFQTKHDGLESHKEEMYKDNSRKLVELLKLFCSEYECDCEVEGNKLINISEFKFSWRVHVKIIKKEMAN